MFNTVKQLIKNKTIANKMLANKKIAIPVGVIVVLGISYSVASWCTGNSLQTKLDDNLIKINQQLTNKLKYDVQFSYINYNKGIFSTTTDLQAALFDKQTKQLLSTKILPLTIDHGPLPWNRLTSGHFSPTMASIYYQMDEQINPTLWQAANNQPFIKANIDVSYDESLDILLDNHALNYNVPEKSSIYQTSAGRVQIAIDPQNNIKINGEIAKIELADQNSKLAINGLSWSGQNTESSLYNQQINIDIKQFQFNSLQTNHLKLALTSQQNKLNIAIKSNLSVQDTFWGQQNIGQGQISFSYESLLDNLLDYLADDISENEHNEQMSNSPTSNENNNTTSFAINQFLWQNQYGDLSANLDLKLIGDDLSLTQLNQHNLAFLQTDINLPIKPLAYMLAQFNQPQKDGVTELELNQQNNYIRQISATLLQNVKFIHSDLATAPESGKLSMSLNYAENDNSATINGESMNKNKFWQTVNQLYQYCQQSHSSNHYHSNCNCLSSCGSINVT